jgi:hypothetical protein
MGWRTLALSSLIVGGLACASTHEPAARTASPPLQKRVKIGVVPLERVLMARDRPEADARETTLRELFRDSGCDAFDPIRARELRTPRVVCRIRGKRPETILVTSEYGRAPRSGRDGWEAASLLPLIADALSVEPREYTLLFAAFEDAPDGMRTEGALARTLAMFPAAERPSIKAWLSLSAARQEVRAAWTEGSNELLVADFLAVAKYSDTPVSLVRLSGPDDGIPTVHALAALVGHKDDDDYLASYRNFAAYVAFIDYSIDARTSGATEDDVELAPGAMAPF